MRMDRDEIVAELAEEGVTREVIVRRFEECLEKGGEGKEELIDVIWECVQLSWGFAMISDLIEQLADLR